MAITTFPRRVVMAAVAHRLANRLEGSGAPVFIADPSRRASSGCAGRKPITGLPPAPC